MLEGNHVIVREKIILQDMYYKNHKVLSYTIKYPKFISDRFEPFTSKLNLYYKTRALMYEKDKIKKLYQMAIVDYEYAVKNNFPIRPYEAYTDYFVSYNQDCAISLYFDQYEYTGGAHGNTLRYSDSWNLPYSRPIVLKDLFYDRKDYQEYIIQNIIKQIDNEIASGNGAYFDDYAELVRANFKENNFYLTEEGVVVYFQQYDIAPYASGMPTFLIPYSAQGPLHPTCKISY